MVEPSIDPEGKQTKITENLFLPLIFIIHSNELNRGKCTLDCKGLISIIIGFISASLPSSSIFLNNSCINCVFWKCSLALQFNKNFCSKLDEIIWRSPVEKNKSRITRISKRWNHVSSGGVGADGLMLRYHIPRIYLYWFFHKDSVFSSSSTEVSPRVFDVLTDKDFSMVQDEGQVKFFDTLMWANHLERVCL